MASPQRTRTPAFPAASTSRLCSTVVANRARSRSETTPGRPISIAETDAPKRPRRDALEPNTDRLSRGDPVGHDPFSASFVDGRAGNVRYRDVEPAPPRCDSRGQAGRPPSDDKNVRRSRHHPSPGTNDNNVAVFIHSR